MTTEPVLEDLLNAPTEITTSDGSTYELTTQLYQNFFPPIPPEGAPILGQLRIVETTEMKTGLFAEPPKPTNFYYISGGVTYELAAGDEWVNEDSDSTRFHLNFTPSVELGETVDIVIRLVEGQQEYFLRAEDQPISSAY